MLTYAADNEETQLTKSPSAVNCNATEVDLAFSSISILNTCETPRKMLDKTFPTTNVNKVKTLTKE